MQSFFKIDLKSKDFKYYFSSNYIEENIFFNNFNINTLKTLLNNIEGGFWGYFYFGNGQISLFRDSFGLCPLYYQILNDNFCLSTSIANFEKKYLEDIDETTVIQYLNFFEPEAYPEASFFKSIKSIIPGHIFLYDGKLSQKTYHCFLKISNLDLSNSDSINSVRSKFLKSVKTLLPKNHKIASQLSGGIDSSSIVSVLKRIFKIDVFTVERRTKNERNEERRYSESIVKELELNHTIIEEIDLDYYEYSKKLINILEVPQEGILPFASNFVFFNYLKKHNLEYIYSGEWGDDINGSKHLYINNLKKNKFWHKYYYSIKKLSDLLDSYSDIKNFFLVFILSQIKKNIKKLNFIELAIIIKYYFKFSENIIKDYSHFFKLLSSKFRNASLVSKLNILNFNVEEIVDNNNTLILNNPQFKVYLRDIFNTSALKVQEERSIIEDHFGIKYLYPFASRDLLNVFANISQELNFQNGYGKGVFRLSMKGILPEIIRTRFNKTSYGNINVDAFKKMYPVFIIEHDEKAIIWRYVNREKFIELSNIINKIVDFSRKEEQICSKLNRVIYCGIWLNSCFSNQIR